MSSELKGRAHLIFYMGACDFFGLMNTDALILGFDPLPLNLD
jgi:hypothetical protein